jgi:phosphomannomutase
MNTFDPSLFRAYDMRGVYPTAMNEDVAYAIGQSFVKVMGAKTVVIGQDVRASGPSLKEAMIKGVTDAGSNVIEVGVISTEMLYYAAAKLECDGGMSITASHNPAQWNGTKFIAKGAIALTKEGKLGDIYAAVNSHEKVIAETPGTVTHEDILPGYITYLQRFAPINLPPMKVVGNVNFGANGKVVDQIVADLPVDLVRMNWEEDGSFPKGTPDPLLPSNRKEISERVVSENANFGVAWDADADRCFFYDEKGRFFPGYYINALLTKTLLEKSPGSAVVLEPRLTWATKDATKQGGGTPVITRAGHAYIKHEMRTHNAVFGGEISAHYYYRDYFGCDSGAVTFLLVLDIFGKLVTEGKTVSALHDEYRQHYPATEEMNFTTDRALEIIEGAKVKYSDATQETVDGISIEYPDFRFNLRMSNTEPVLRLNLEAHEPAVLDAKLAEVQSYIETFGATLRNDG